MNLGQIFKNLTEKKNKFTLYIILIITIIILLVFSGTGSKKEPPQTTEPTLAYQNDELEKKIKAILKTINGAGAVEVALTYEHTETAHLAQNEKSEKEGTEKTVVVISEHPYILKKEYPKVKGVVVTAEGADSSQVKNDLRLAVIALTGAPEHMIQILRR